MVKYVRKTRRAPPPPTTAPFAWKIADCYGLSMTKGDLGIEIEAEFKSREGGDYMIPWNPNDSSRGSRFWRTEADGSLRRGAEYVLDRPILIGDLDEAMADWAKWTNKFPFKFSNRCSTHMHVNAQSLTLTEFIRVCTAWWMIETALVHSQGEAREGNLFALRGKDATGIILGFAADMSSVFSYTSRGMPRPMSENEYRYAVLNHAALQKFGSLEFRFMRGMSDPNEISFWAKALYTFVHAAKDIEVGEIVRLTGGTNLDRLHLLQLLFGEDGAAQVISRVGGEWSSLIEGQYQYGVLLDTSYDTALRKIANGLKMGKNKYRFNVVEDDDRFDQEGQAQLAVYADRWEEEFDRPDVGAAGPRRFVLGGDDPFPPPPAELRPRVPDARELDRMVENIILRRREGGER